MSELLELRRLEETKQLFTKQLNFGLETETVAITEARGRVLAEDIISQIDLPPFTRSTMDGYAVKAKDTFGGSETMPIYLDLVGEVKMGAQANQELKSGEAVKIATGGMLPPGADAVVMVEYTETLDGMIEVTKAVAKGENIVFQGEDISQGATLLNQGQELRAQDIGALAGIGVTEVEVFTSPQVTVFSTGDELVPPEVEPEVGQIRDINSYSLGSLVKELGAKIDYGGIIADQQEQLQTKLEKKVAISDVVVLSGGSSVGVKDLTIEVLNQLGDPGVIVQGIAIKPGKPTILAIINDTPVIGLPGHPTSAMVVFTRLVAPIIRQLLGQTGQQVESKVVATINRNLASTKGREEYIRVKLERKKGQLVAKPILGKSSLITTMVKADGLVKLGLGQEGVKAGTEVEVLTF